MNQVFKTGLLLLLVIMGAMGTARAFDLNANGQISAWFTAADTGTQGVWEGGLRFMPEFSFDQDISDTTRIGAEVALNMFMAPSTRDTSTESDLRLYRAQLRYVTAQSETSAGLQKINFGPGRLLRPLRWFDQINPDDPLQLTNGVYGIRFRYNTVKNTGIWLWLLYGNEDLKGYEQLQTLKGSFEGGGRIQGEFLKGELAASTHLRQVAGGTLGIPDFTESRLGIDGRWDVGVGLWFEAVLNYQASRFLPYQWTKLMSAGTDYTFNIGNGLYVLGEHMVSGLSETVFGLNENVHVSALSLNYPIGMLDQLTANLYYKWSESNWYLNLTWRRAYDRFSIYAIGFWNPDAAIATGGRQNNVVYGGKGIQIIVVFHY